MLPRAILGVSFLLLGHSAAVAAAPLRKMVVREASALSRTIADARFDLRSAAKLVSSFGVVSSLTRTIERNRAVGGAPNSYHLSGRAIDLVRRPGVTHAEVDAALRRAGLRVVESLDEGDHSHFAFGVPEGEPRPRIFAAASSQPVVKTVPSCVTKDRLSLSSSNRTQRVSSAACERADAGASPRPRLLADELAGTLIDQRGISDRKLAADLP